MIPAPQRGSSAASGWDVTSPRDSCQTAFAISSASTSQIAPPFGLVTGAVELPVMTAAQWHREFVADLERRRSRLRRPKVMRVRRRSSAQQARLRRNETKMRLIALPARVDRQPFVFCVNGKPASRESCQISPEAPRSKAHGHGRRFGEEKYPDPGIVGGRIPMVIPARRL